MASAATAASLPHRTVSSIRAGGGGTGGTGGAGGAYRGAPATPHTPSRPSIPSIAFGSPSSLRAEDDLVVIELGARNLRVGFAGDPAPKRVAAPGPEQQRRVGDFRAWGPGYRDDWRARSAAAGRPWGSDYELWQLDVRGQDLDLVGDKLERELRDAFTKYVFSTSPPSPLSLPLPGSGSEPVRTCLLTLCLPFILGICCSTRNRDECPWCFRPRYLYPSFPPSSTLFSTASWPPR